MGLGECGENRRTTGFIAGSHDLLMVARHGDETPVGGAVMDRGELQGASSGS